MFEIRLKSRMIGPAFLQSESLAKVPFETRILFVALWMVTELTPKDILGIDGKSMGLLIDKPVVLHSFLFPYDRKLNIDKMLQQLHDIGAIVRYEADGYKCIWVPRFKMMQSTHTNERRTKIPLPSKQIQERHAENNIIFPDKDEPEIEPTDDIPYQEILDDLNEKRKAKRPFTATPGNMKLINGRWADGFKLEDFIHVHTVKCKEWLGTKWEKFLRPSTLWSATNFQGYVNERSPKQIENTEKFLKEATCPKCENVGPIIYDLKDWEEAREFTGKDPIYQAGTVSMTCQVDTCRHTWSLLF